MRSNMGGGCYGKPYRFEIDPEDGREPLALTGEIAFETHSAMMLLPRGPERLEFLKETYERFNLTGEVEDQATEQAAGGDPGLSGCGSVGSGADGEHGTSPITRDLPSNEELTGRGPESEAYSEYRVNCPNCGIEFIIKRRLNP